MQRYSLYKSCSFKLAFSLFMALLASCATFAFSNGSAQAAQSVAFQEEAERVANAIVPCNDAVTPSTTEDAAPSTTIYVLAAEETDCTIIRNVDEQGAVRFGMIDCAQGSAYPDGSDPRYPLRPSIVIGHSETANVKKLMTSLGVTSENFEFFLGTHPHSDHIGAASELFDDITPQRFYLAYYSDSLIKNDIRRYDNLFQYDNACKIAATSGSELIQYFDENAPVDPKQAHAAPTSHRTLDGISIDSYTARPTFTLGGTTIEVLNCKNLAGASTVFHDANDFSLGVKITDPGTQKTAFIGGDINNANYDDAPFTNYDEERLAPALGHIDFLKLNHHGLAQSNTPQFISQITPSIAYQTGSFSYISAETFSALNAQGTKLFEAGEVAKAGYLAIQVSLSTLDSDNNPTITHSGNTTEMFRIKTTDLYHLWCYKDGLPQRKTGWVTKAQGSAYFAGNAFAQQNSWINSAPRGDNTTVSTGFIHTERERYVGDDGLMCHDTWQWDGYGWYYFNSKGSLLHDQWFQDNDNWFYLDSAGHYLKGCHKIGSDVFFFTESGSMLLNSWKWIEPGWCYFGPVGAMLYTWQNIDNVWYYLNPLDGTMQTGWISLDHWYYLDPSNGHMMCGWQLIDGFWYHLNVSNGAMDTTWFWDNAWYYLGTNGQMAHGWVWVDAWYLCAEDGHMLTGWQWVNNRWYYLGKDGTMAHDCWVDGYWLNSDGSMA